MNKLKFGVWGWGLGVKIFVLFLLITFYLSLTVLLGASLITPTYAGHCRTSPVTKTEECIAGPGFCMPNDEWWCDIPNKNEHSKSNVKCSDSNEKKIGVCPSSLGHTSATGQSATQTQSGPVDSLIGDIKIPTALKGLIPEGTSGDKAITIILSKTVELIYVFASTVFVIYLIYSAIEFIFSEGHKDSVAEARQRMTWAIVGIVVLSVMFVFLKVLSKITGLTFFSG